MSCPAGILAIFSFAVLAFGASTETEIEQRANEVLSRMTLDEKIGQMSLSTSMSTPISESIKAEIRSGRWGGFLNAGSPADRMEAQLNCADRSRLKIPLLFGRDVIHGYRTIFPIPLGQAASWDPPLMEQAASNGGARGQRGRYPLGVRPDGRHCTRPPVGEESPRAPAKIRTWRRPPERL